MWVAINPMQMILPYRQEIMGAKWCSKYVKCLIYFMRAFCDVEGNDAEPAKVTEEEVKTEPVTIKTEPVESDDVSPSAGGAVKSENSNAKTETAVLPKTFELQSPVAEFHASLVKRMKERAELVGNIGPYRRALCARRDLAVRRALCKVDKVTNVACVQLRSLRF